MLRPVIAISVIATIFMHSPERTPVSLTADLEAFARRTQSSLVEAASRNLLAQSITETALRRTFSDATLPPPPSHGDERAASLAHHP